MKRGLVSVAAGLIGVLALGGAAQAAVPATLHDEPACTTKDAADGETMVDTEIPYVFCDDGVPSLDPLPGPGGLIPNLTGAGAVTVPARYEAVGGNTFAGLPAKAPDADEMLGADPGGNVALDVDVSLPATPPPAGGYPMVVLMHGCCGGDKTGWEASTLGPNGEKWHFNNAWFASRGYVVVTYTARGFVGAAPGLRGSTGETQLDSRSFEVNDYQALACNVLAASEAESFDDVSPAPDVVDDNNVIINPDKVVTTGGSYGGGFAWLALTDPEWTCNADTGADTVEMSLAASAPRYGWTDLAYTLVPNGSHSVEGGPGGTQPATNGCSTGPKDLSAADCVTPSSPTGVPKSSIVGALFLSGTLLPSSHTTFPAEITESFACLQGAYPLEDNPLCETTLDTYLPRFLRERSAYYQNDFFDKVDDDGGSFDTDYVTPVFNAGTLTDPLFPMYENRRMANRLLAVNPGYPIQQYYGDYQHFVQNKAKEWADICGGDHHVCTLDDFGGDLNANPASIVDDPGTAGVVEGLGVTTRLNRFIDNYAEPASNPAQADPSFDVTSSLQVCPDVAAGLGVPADEPGPRSSSSSFEGLTPNSLTVEMTGAQTTTSTVAGNSHASNADPLVNSATNGSRCPRETSVAGPGVASYTSEALGSEATMIGATTVTARFATPITGSTDGLQLNARLYDVLPDGTTSLMVDRGPRRVTAAEAAAGEVTWELHGNGWRFQTGHRIRIELSQDDQPFMKATTLTSSLSLTGADLLIPTVELFGTDVPGTPDPKPTTPTTTPSSPPAATTPTKKKCKKGFKLKKGKCKKKKKKKK